MRNGNLEPVSGKADAMRPAGANGAEESPHSLPIDEVLAHLEASRHGLSRLEAADRLQRIGPNALPHTKPPSGFRVFLSQFTSPLIYVLLLAALVSLVIREYSDAVLIAAVLLVNAVIGTLQEYSAQRAAEALNRLVTTKARVLRDGDAFLVDSEDLVPGDVVRLESGDKVPADMRLLSGRDLEVDESLLTGESDTVGKDADAALAVDTPLGDRVNMVFAGTMVSRGRQYAVVVNTAGDTELGKIASGVLTRRQTKAPLIVRMERFTRRIAIAVGTASVAMAGIALTAGHRARRGLPSGGGAGGVGDPRGPARGADRGAGHRHAADGEAERHRPPARGGRGAGLLHLHRHRQDRDPDGKPADGATDRVAGRRALGGHRRNAGADRIDPHPVGQPVAATAGGARPPQPRRGSRQ
jgi:hypothetical protein